jgi:hypothetical protein
VCRSWCRCASEPHRNPLGGRRYDKYGFGTFRFRAFQFSNFSLLELFEGEIKFRGVEGMQSGIQLPGGVAMSVFDEKYRVVGVESDRLLLRGVHSGDVLTIVNSEPDIPLTQEEYPLGKLIALTDPSSAPLN